MKYDRIQTFKFHEGVLDFLVVVVGGGGVPSFFWRSPIPMRIQWIPMKGPLKVPRKVSCQTEFSAVPCLSYC